MTLTLLQFYPYVKFHSIASVELELLQNKKHSGKSVTHGQTGRWADGQGIPVYLLNYTSTMPPLNERNFSEELPKLEITEPLVCNKSKSLDLSNSPGIDAISTKILKECHGELA